MKLSFNITSTASLSNNLNASHSVYNQNKIKRMKVKSVKTRGGSKLWKTESSSVPTILITNTIRAEQSPLGREFPRLIVNAVEKTRSQEG